jgi:hypothetical protein
LEFGATRLPIRLWIWKIMALAFQCPHCDCAHQLDDASAGISLKCWQCEQAILAPGSPAPAPRQSAPGDSDSLQLERNDMTLLSPGPTRFLNQITRHIDRAIGPCPMVFHEIISADIHLDLHIVPPQRGPATADHPFGRDFYTIVTSGMSSLAMPATPALGGLRQQAPEYPRYAELMITLPATWPGLRPDGTFVQDHMSEEANWWPIRWLKMLARMPHEFDTCVGNGYTIPNSPSDQSFASNTGFASILLLPSVLHPAARHLVAHDDVTIEFMALWPLYPEEMELKANHGLEALRTAFAAADVTDLLNIHRPNVARSV